MKTVTEEEAVHPRDISIWLLLTVSNDGANRFECDQF